MPIHNPTSFRNLQRGFPCGFLLLSIFCAFAARAAEKPLGVSATEWPGVTFQVMEIQRVGNDRLLAVLRLSADASAENPTFIGVAPVAGWANRKDLTEKQLASGDYDPTPFSLTTAVLTEQGTKQQFRALPNLPSKPFLGPNTLITSLRPGNWLQLAVQFPAPPPPAPEPGAPTPIQRISLLLPHAKSVIKDIALPSK